MNIDQRRKREEALRRLEDERRRRAADRSTIYSPLAEPLSPFKPVNLYTSNYAPPASETCSPALDSSSYSSSCDSSSSSGGDF